MAAFCFVRCTCVRCIQISRCFPWLQADHCRLIMPRPPKGGAAAEAAAEATAAAIAKELRGKFDSEVVRKETLKMFTTFSGILDAEAVSKKIMAKREAKRAKNGISPLLPILYSYVCPSASRLVCQSVSLSICQSVNLSLCQSFTHSSVQKLRRPWQWSQSSHACG